MGGGAQPAYGNYVNGGRVHYLGPPDAMLLRRSCQPDSSFLTPVRLALPVYCPFEGLWDDALRIVTGVTTTNRLVAVILSDKLSGRNHSAVELLCSLCL